MELVRRATLLALAAAAATLIAPQAAPAASTGHSGWSWGSPSPQGNTLHAIEFAAGRGYAAGEFGTLLRTDDGGTHWTGVPTGVTATLRHVRILGPESVVVGGGCVVRRSDDGGRTFRRLPWTSAGEDCGTSVAAIAFPTPDVGYLVLEDGTVLRSADGGASWQRRAPVPGATDVAFVTPDVGVAVTADGAIQRTLDAGGSWTPVVTGTPRLAGVHFATPLVGYAVGTGGTVLKTLDGGGTWTALPTRLPGPAPDFASIRCAGAALCMLATERRDQVVRTVNGGASFLAVLTSGEPLHAVALSSATRAVAVGIGGATVVSADAGATWARVGGRLLGVYTGIEALSSDTAFAYGHAGAFARTSDGGRTWTEAGVSTPEEVRDVAFADPLTGYALDAAGRLLKTENGGASWATLATGTAAPPRAVVAAGRPAVVLLAGPRGLRRSTDGGQSFVAVRDRDVAGARLDTFDDAIGGVVFAYDANGRALAVSTTAGRSWRAVGGVPLRRGVREYDWISGRVGFALGGDGRLYGTRDGGRRWRWLPAPGAAPIDGIAFSSSRSGWLRVTGPPGTGLLLHTTNGGVTFRPQLVQRTPVAGVAAPGGGTEFLLGAAVIGATPGYTPSQSLMYTFTGGDQGARTAISLRVRQRTPRSRRGRPRVVTVVVEGRLRPAEGGEGIVVSAQSADGSGARTVIVTARADGRFASTWRLRGRVVFAAQYAGDDDRRGAGSRARTATPR